MTVGGLSGLLRAQTAAAGDMERHIVGGFSCDILSQTMARGFRGMAWITHQANMNALAVAVMTDAACVIFPEGIEPERDVVRRAEAERITLLQTKESAFELAGRLYAAGIGREEQ